jgi:hypothetical protein
MTNVQNIYLFCHRETLNQKASIKNANLYHSKKAEKEKSHFLFFLSSLRTGSFRRKFIFIDDRRLVLEARKQNLFLHLHHSFFSRHF